MYLDPRVVDLLTKGLVANSEPSKEPCRCCLSIMARRMRMPAVELKITTPIGRNITTVQVMRVNASQEATSVLINCL